MCVVSDKLKLCTCAAANADKLRHSWTFHTRTAGKAEMIIGDVMMPSFLDPLIHATNCDLLLTLLNAGNPFDVALNPKRGDRLCLAFTCNEHDEKVHYGFEYDGRRWIKRPFDLLEWYWHHDKAAFGKITRALKR